MSHVSYDPRDYREILDLRDRKRADFAARREARLLARCRATDARMRHYRGRLLSLVKEYELAR